MVDKFTKPPYGEKVVDKINEIIDNLGGGGGGTATDVQINGTSITSNNVANIVTNTAYDESSNKIATMSDIPENEIFIATYGTTFYSEITNAYEDGKAVFVKYINGIYPLVGVNSNYVSFCGVSGTIVNYITCESSSVLGWSIASSYTAEQTSNKTTSLSDSSTNTQYPSAKCVYDELVDKADVDLSNVSSSITSIPPTALKNFDGQWVWKSEKLSQATAIGVYDLTSVMTSYLPNDSYSYEVLFSISINRDDSSGTNTRCFMYNPDITDTPSVVNSWIGCQADGANWQQGDVRGIGIIKPDRKLTLNIEGYKLKATYFLAIAYRRIGTNT